MTNCHPVTWPIVVLSHGHLSQSHMTNGHPVTWQTLILSHDKLSQSHTANCLPVICKQSPVKCQLSPCHLPVYHITNSHLVTWPTTTSSHGLCIKRQKCRHLFPVSQRNIDDIIISLRVSRDTVYHVSLSRDIVNNAHYSSDISHFLPIFVRVHGSSYTRGLSNNMCRGYSVVSIRVCRKWITLTYGRVSGFRVSGLLLAAKRENVNNKILMLPGEPRISLNCP